MATEFLSSLGTATIAIFHREEQAAGHLRGYLQNKGYQLEDVGDPRQLISVAREGTSDVVIVVISTSLEEIALCQILKEGDDAPPVVALCDGAGKEALESRLAAKVRPDCVLVRPVPFVHILGEVEKLLDARAKVQQASGARPAFPFASLLAGLWHNTTTGRLQLTAEGVQTTIYLREGVPVFAEQGSLGDTLGRMLIRTERITNEQFSQAVNLITDRMVDNEQMRLGEALVELGILTAEDIDGALREQVRNKILACFRWQRMHSDFSEGEEHLEGVGEFASPVEVLLIQGIKTVLPAQLARYLTSVLGRYPTLAQPDWEVAERFDLHGKEQSFLTTITGAKTIEQLRQGSMLDPVHCDQLLAGLLLGKALVLGDKQVSKAAPARQPKAVSAPRAPKDPPRPQARKVARIPVAGSAAVPIETAAPVEPASTPVARPSAGGSTQGGTLMALYLRVMGKADHDVLRVGEGASPTEIEHAYDKQSRQIATAMDNKKLNAEAIQRGKDAATQLQGARDRLLSGQPSPAGRQSAPPDETKRRLSAEQAFQQGIELYRAGEASRALDEFRRAAELQPDLEYQLWVSWLTYRTAKDGRGKKRAQKEALQHATQLYGQDGNGVLANLVLGHLLAQGGKLERAKRHLLLASHHDILALAEIQDELRAVDALRTGGGQGKKRGKRR